MNKQLLTNINNSIDFLINKLTNNLPEMNFIDTEKSIKNILALIELKNEAQILIDDIKENFELENLYNSLENDLEIIKKITKNDKNNIAKSSSTDQQIFQLD